MIQRAAAHKIPLRSQTVIEPRVDEQLVPGTEIDIHTAQIAAKTVDLTVGVGKIIVSAVGTSTLIGLGIKLQVIQCNRV